LAIATEIDRNEFEPQVKQPMHWLSDQVRAFHRRKMPDSPACNVSLNAAGKIQAIICCLRIGCVIRQYHNKHAAKNVAKRAKRCMGGVFRRKTEVGIGGCRTGCY
jgi:hypothetical protein